MAALTKAFAAAIGKTVRTAQRMRQANHPDWQKFVGQQASMNVTVDVPPDRRSVAAEAVALKARDADLATAGPSDSELDKSVDQMSEAELMEHQHWMIWKEAARAWKSALKDGDYMIASGFGQHCVKARAEYIKARDSRVQWEVSIRRSVPISEFSALRAAFIVPLANLLKGLPAELATITNPNDSNYAFRALTDYLESRLEPQMHRLIEGVNEYLEGGTVAE